MFQNTQHPHHLATEGKNGKTSLLKTLAATTLLALTCGTAAQAADQKFSIPAQPLSTALISFSEQSNYVVVTSGDLVNNLQAPDVNGILSPEEALDRLLAGSGLRYRISGNGTVTIISNASDQDSQLHLNSSSAGNAAHARLQQNQADQSQQQPGREEQIAMAETEEEAMVLEEIIVTGSHIRGARSASPVFTFDREDFDKTGLATPQDIIRRMPQNFNGGIAEFNPTLAPAGPNESNLGLGTGVNLRGQGSDSSLILLNGHRISASGNGQFVDVSLIPLSAIERVEVLTDGASAIYGSDAVGGVVNFQLRKDYEGAETRLRYGTVTDGDSEEYKVGQTFGTNWRGGNALISYEYYKRTPLDSEDRSFTKDVIDPTDLIPRQERHSVFFTGRQELKERVELFATAFYSERDSERSFGSNVGSNIQFSSSTTKQYGGIFGTTVDIGQSWQAEVAATYSRTELDSAFERFFFPVDTDDEPFDSGENQSINALWSIDAKADGTLFTLSGGDVKGAIGTQFRKETLEDPLSMAEGRVPLDQERTVTAFFGELFFPFVSQDNRRPGLERLEFSAAVRHEEYSDFGSSTNPKFGLVWSPVGGLNLRGTFGTSFRAPLLTELAEINLASILLNAPNPASPTGTTLTLIGFGNNADLTAETATTWTAGLDYQPQGIPGLTLGLTYFNIKFEDRIDSEFAFFDVFLDPRFSSLITLDPDPVLITKLTTPPSNFFDFSGGADPFTAEAFFDGRLRNFATVETSGLDFNIAYGFDSNFGSWNLGVSGTYLFEQEEQLLPTDDPVDLVDTPYNPVDLKLRGTVGWNHNGFSTNVFINYVDSYSDNRTDPETPVDSWTTIDLTLTYNTRDSFSNSLFNNLQFQFSVQNLFDEDPPFVAAAFGGQETNFDPNNANALGRFISFQITKNW
ncbi:TonB-dependent receptor [Luteithermobacter gelatinilyticus]|uniref:TonB-dependent receptor n=1 Tax=Luteithermobacter gelatinilyticus TaxID=2582913 RepID=UPI00143DD4FA|nr:TonB-dependent receptor [Luteithermobacter gelatinilyticus]|tara:strand:+ start:23109 stop:25853 length:2745 start_codon:yes stop_codon:yes gene_type:complete